MCRKYFCGKSDFYQRCSHAKKPYSKFNFASVAHQRPPRRNEPLLPAGHAADDGEGAGNAQAEHTRHLRGAPPDARRPPRASNHHRWHGAPEPGDGGSTGPPILRLDVGQAVARSALQALLCGWDLLQPPVCVPESAQLYTLVTIAHSADSAQSELSLQQLPDMKRYKISDIQQELEETLTEGLHLNSHIQSDEEKRKAYSKLCHKASIYNPSSPKMNFIIEPEAS